MLDAEGIAKAIDDDVCRRLGATLPDAEALIFITRIYRPLRPADLNKTVRHLRQHADLTPYSDSELQAWCKHHRSGWYREVSGFEKLLANLKAIEPRRRASAKATAWHIAGGSGRTRMAADIAAELAQLFPDQLADPDFNPEMLFNQVWLRLREQSQQD